MTCKNCNDDLPANQFRPGHKQCKTCQSTRYNRKRLITGSQSAYDYTGMDYLVGLFIGQYDEQKFINYIQ